MEKYYLISGKALINVNFRTSKKWLEPNQDFGNELISESELKKYKRFLQIDTQIECDETGTLITKKSVKKETKSEEQQLDLGNATA